MVQISGKYEVVESKNYHELLVKMGVPEELAKRGQEAKGTLEVVLDGEKVRLITDSNNKKNISELVLNQEVDDTLVFGGTVKSTTSVNGNVLTINSKSPEGDHGSRVFTFSDTGLELKIVSTRGAVTAEAFRIYKRI